MKKDEKMYIVRKYIRASSVSSAIQKDKTTKVHEVFVDDEWRKSQKDNLASAIGFTI